MRRVIKPGGLLALVGYNLLKVDEPTDALIEYFYHTTLQGCWDAERRLVETAYQTIPFPFRRFLFQTWLLNIPALRSITGAYLGTWSAVQHFIRKRAQSDRRKILRPG